MELISTQIWGEEWTKRYLSVGIGRKFSVLHFIQILLQVMVVLFQILIGLPDLLELPSRDLQFSAQETFNKRLGVLYITQDEHGS